MLFIADRVQENTLTTGTGTVTVSGATAGHRTFAAAGANGRTVPYMIEDGDAWEAGIGVVSGTSITRGLCRSSTGSLLSLTGSATISIVAHESVFDGIDRTRLLDAAPGANDIEFNDEATTSLPSGYVWVNQGGASFAIENGWASIVTPVSALDNNRMVMRTIPSPFNSVTACVRGALRTGQVGLAFRNSSNFKIYTFSLSWSGTAGLTRFTVYSWTAPSTFNGVESQIECQPTGEVLLRVTQNTANDWDFEAMLGGGAWFPVLMAEDVGAFVTPNQVGMSVNNLTGSHTGLGSFRFLRFT